MKINYRIFVCISRGLSNKKSVFFVKLLGAGYTRVRVIHEIKFENDLFLRFIFYKF